MNQSKVELIDLGFSVADGENIRLQLKDATLCVQFTNWQQREVEFVCHEVIAHRWQDADYVLCEEERDDSTYEVIESDWLKVHVDQQCTWGDLPFHHFKMNFNASGVLEVLCRKIEKAAQPGATDNPGDAQ